MPQAVSARSAIEAFEVDRRTGREVYALLFNINQVPSIGFRSGEFAGQPSRRIIELSLKN